MGDLKRQAQFDAIMFTLAQAGLGQQVPAESSLIEKVPDVDAEDLDLNEREQAFAAILQLFGVAGPLAQAIAAASGYLSSLEAKEDLGRIFDALGDAGNWVMRELILSLIHI